jgi:glycosyltransferase involved in cell wall biosynthesis
MLAISRTSPAPRAAWHLVSCGYPPTIGGVASYTAAVAKRLAARGSDVHVWCPGAGDVVSGGIHVHARPNRWSLSDLRTVGRELDAHPAPRVLFVQWVPHGYGYKSLNGAFAAWVASRAMHGDHVEVMVHEPWLAFEPTSPRRSAAALAHRLMMLTLLRSARRAWVSIPAWRSTLQRVAGRVEVGWLPVPALLPVATDHSAVHGLKSALSPAGAALVGHFGTYGTLVTGLLAPAMTALLQTHRTAMVVLMGQGSREYRDAFVAAHPEWSARVTATGTLDERTLSLHLQAVDVMLQPYPDGISARRSSATSLLAHGCAIVTTRGPLTEGLWRESGAVDTAAPHASELSRAVTRLLDDTTARQTLGRAAHDLHERVFSIDHTLSALLGAAARRQSAVA